MKLVFQAEVNFFSEIKNISYEPETAANIFARDFLLCRRDGKIANFTLNLNIIFCVYLYIY